MPYKVMPKAHPGSLAPPAGWVADTPARAAPGAVRSESAWAGADLCLQDISQGLADVTATRISLPWGE